MSSTLTREITLDRAQANTAARTVRASLSSESPVLQHGVHEVLMHTAEAIDLSRAAGGLPLLVAHDRTALPVGVVEDVHIQNRRLVGTLRFGSSVRANEAWEDVAAGIVRGLSISYRVDDSEVLASGGYRATKWALIEASLVGVPADPSVGINRSAAEQSSSTGTTTMTETTTTPTAADERQRAADITSLCTRHQIPAETMSRYLTEGTSVESVRAAILDSLATHSEQTSVRNLLPSSWHTGGEQGDQSRSLMEEYVVGRVGGPRASAGNPFVHARMLDLARERAEVYGVRTTSLSPSQIFERALSTSDFPNLLANAMNKTLALKYAAFPAGLKRAARASTIRDFRSKMIARLGEAPTLLRVNEHAEFKFGSMLDAAESYSLFTYGRIVSLTRQALINDDLSALESLALRFAQSAAELEATVLTGLLTNNPTMTEDGVALFHATHNNLSTGAGSALSLTSLSAARKAMRLQKGLDGTTPVNAAPAYLVVPASLETLGQQLLTQTTPAQFDQANPFNDGALTLIVEPRLDATSTTAWFLAASHEQIDTLEYSFLEGEPGPQIQVEPGFEIDGMSMRCRLDLGAGVLDWRGLHKANGA
jgi:HK97 family phage prohead protease